MVYRHIEKISKKERDSKKFKFDRTKVKCENTACMPSRSHCIFYARYGDMYNAVRSSNTVEDLLEADEEESTS